jgi:hypothetical protein
MGETKWYKPKASVSTNLGERAAWMDAGLPFLFTY